MKRVLSPLRTVVCVTALLSLTLVGCGGAPSFLESGESVTVEELFPEGVPVAEVCPKVSVRRGTQSFSSYAGRNDSDPAALIYKGSIQDTVRECAFTGKTVSVDIGVAGRVISGPQGVNGYTATMPVRFTVIRANVGQVSSDVRQVAVSVQPGQRSASLSYVERGITIALEEGALFSDYRFVVGFDIDLDAL